MLAAIQTELQLVSSPEWWNKNYLPLINIIMIDIVLAGDNAIVVGVAASRVDPKIRSQGHFLGHHGRCGPAHHICRPHDPAAADCGSDIGRRHPAAVGLLEDVPRGRHQPGHDDHEAAAASTDDGTSNVQYVGYGTAIFQIILADVSMSLDNVLAVAGAAKGSPLVLVIGLAIAIVLMAIASHMIARLLARYPWITWVGLLVILYVALDMIYNGSAEVFCKVYAFGCGEPFPRAVFDWASS